VLSPVGSLVVGEQEQAYRGLRDDERLRQSECVRDEASPSELAAPTGNQSEDRGENAHRNYDERQPVMRR
jgi:hypothetical protein